MKTEQEIKNKLKEVGKKLEKINEENETMDGINALIGFSVYTGLSSALQWVLGDDKEVKKADTDDTVEKIRRAIIINDIKFSISVWGDGILTMFIKSINNPVSMSLQTLLNEMSKEELKAFVKRLEEELSKR